MILTFLVTKSSVDTQTRVVTLVTPGARRTCFPGVTTCPCPARVTGAGEGGGAGAVTPLAPLTTPLTAHGLTLNLLRLLLGPGPAFTAAWLTDHFSHILKFEEWHQLPLGHFPLEGMAQAEAEEAVLQLSVGHLSQEACVNRNNKQLLFITDTTAAIKVIVKLGGLRLLAFTFHLYLFPRDFQ